MFSLVLWQLMVSDWKMVALWLIMALILLFALNLSVFVDLLKDQLYRVASFHWGGVTSYGKVYQLFSNKNDFLNFNWYSWIIYLIKGWYHLIFEPISLNGFSFSVLIFLKIYKIAFLFLCVTAMLGFSLSFVKNFRYSMILVLFFLIYGSLFALTEANIVTMLRHRDLITPIIFMYASVFFARIFSKDFQRQMTHKADG
jgi:hypothetical protein